MQITNTINKTYFINKQQIQSTLEPKTKKQDVQNGTRIYPFIDVTICDNLIYQNVLLKTSLEILSEDIVYNDVTIKTENGDILENTLMESFWENNQDEFNNTVLDYLSYGFGGAEIVFDEKGFPAKLYEIQADTLYISKESKINSDGEKVYSYYAVQQMNNSETVKMRLSHLEYDDYDNENLGVCLWFGGGRKSNFFDYPMWISAFNHVSASVSMDILNADKIANGNLVSGILVVKRPPAPITDNDTDIEETLEEKMQSKGNGIFTLELTTLNPNIPLEVDYIQISESNYNYLEELANSCDEKILSVLKVPKARLLIDDTTESMNSQKTNTLYKIYTRELENRQRVFENKMNSFNEVYFEFTGTCNITTPVFIDEKEIEAQTVIQLFDKGLITLGQAISKAQTIFTEFADAEIDEANPIYNERYYNGNPLGLTEEQYTNEVTDFGELIDYLQIP